MTSNTSRPGKTSVWALSVAGIVSILLGGLAIAFPLASSIGVELVFGAVLVAAGIIEAIRAFTGRRDRSVAWSLIFAVLAILAGVILLLNPMEGVVTLTIVLSAFLLIGGAMKTAAAFGARPAPGWVWLLGSGLLSIVLAILLLAGLPGTAYWALGLLIGIDLIFLGVSQIALATGLRDTVA